MDRDALIQDLLAEYGEEPLETHNEPLPYEAPAERGGFWGWHERNIADPMLKVEAAVRNRMPGRMLWNRGYPHAGDFADKAVRALGGVRSPQGAAIGRDNVLAGQMWRRAMQERPYFGTGDITGGRPKTDITPNTENWAPFAESSRGLSGRRGMRDELDVALDFDPVMIAASKRGRDFKGFFRGPQSMRPANQNESPASGIDIDALLGQIEREYVPPSGPPDPKVERFLRALMDPPQTKKPLHPTNTPYNRALLMQMINRDAPPPTSEALSRQPGVHAPGDALRGPGRGGEVVPFRRRGPDNDDTPLLPRGPYSPEGKADGGEVLDEVDDVLYRIAALENRDDSRRRAQTPFPDPYAGEVKGYQDEYDAALLRRRQQALINLGMTAVPFAKAAAGYASQHPNLREAVDRHVRLKKRDDDWRVNPVTEPFFRGYLLAKSPEYTGTATRLRRLDEHNAALPRDAPWVPASGFLTRGEMGQAKDAGWGAAHLKGHAFSTAGKEAYLNDMARRGGLDPGGAGSALNAVLALDRRGWARAPYIPTKPETLY